MDSATLGEKILPPEAGEGYTADYDIELWGWSGSVDPNALLQIFKCDAIGSSSDSQYCNPEFDKMYDDQLRRRHRGGAQDDPHADAEPHLRQGPLRHPVLRRQPGRVSHRPVRRLAEPAEANGTPFFTYGTLDYTMLTDAQAVPPGAPSAEAPAGSAAASAGTSPLPSAAGPGTRDARGAVLLGLLASSAHRRRGVVVVRPARRSGGVEADDDD